jgi:signal transduction histidine kinase
LHELIRRSATFVRKEAESRGIQIILNFVPDVLYSEIDRRLTNQVFLNLFKNAMEAMPQGGRLEVRTRRYSVDERSTARAVVEIVDSGLGIDQDEIKKVFRPLYSTKPRGLGLGLPFCRQIVEQQGGEIQLASKKGGGTIVTLSLPLH